MIYFFFPYLFCSILFEKKLYSKKVLLNENFHKMNKKAAATEKKLFKEFLLKPRNFRLNNRTAQKQVETITMVRSA